MNKTVKLLVASIVAIAANSAIAGPGNWYIGAGAGMSSYKDWLSQEDITAFKNDFRTNDLGFVNFDGSESAESEDKASAFKLFGGYSFNEYIAVELSYIDMGEVDANSSSSGTFFDSADNPVDGDLFATARASVDAFTLDANLSYPVASFAALFVKAGVYSADAELESSAGGSITTESINESRTDSSTGLHFGIGANFWVTDAIGLRAEWERLDNVEANGGESDVDLVSAALIYSF
jgi:opacity protein-like surface antigen